MGLGKFMETFAEHFYHFLNEMTGSVSNFAGRKIEPLRSILRISKEDMNFFEGYKKTE